MDPQQFKHFIDGEFVSSTKTFEKYRPTDSVLVGHIHEGGQSEVNAAVAAARAAMKGPWGKMTVEQRIDLLYKVADEITRRFDDFGEKRAVSIVHDLDARRRRCLELRAARAQGGHWGGLPLEHALAADDLESRASTGLRQHRHRQTLRGNAGNRNSSGRSHECRWRTQRGL